MRGEWVIEMDDYNLAIVLSHESGAKAWFSQSELMKVRDWPRGDPFVILAYLIQSGARPYKTEGGFEQQMALPVPQKKLEAA